MPSVPIRFVYYAARLRVFAGKEHFKARFMLRDRHNVWFFSAVKLSPSLS
jgi:hypothetical protein